MADPHAWYAEALRGDRVVHDPRADLWHVFRHDDVREFLRDADLWSTAKRLERVPPDQRIVRLLTSDPPSHTALRHRFDHAYRPRRLGGLEPSIRRRARQLIADGLAAGTFDLIGDIAAPLTREVIGELIGVPGDDLEECARRAIRNPLGTVVPDADGDLYPVIWMGAGEPENNRHFQAYFAGLIDERRRVPRDDLVTALASMSTGAPSEGADAPDGTLNVGALLDEQFGAGQNTTVHLLGMLFAELLARPEDIERLRHDPSLLRSAVEEGLRWWDPLPARSRVATRDTEIDGVAIPEGSVALAWTQAANLDPRRFADPEVFDIARADNAHLSFGFGAHFCLGAALARLEGRIVLEEWLAVVGEAQRSDEGPLRWLDSYMMRGLVRLGVSVQPR